MEGIIPALRGSAKERLCRQLRKCRDTKLRIRYLVIVNLANGRSADQTATAVQVARSSVYRIARRFREAGEAGLIDRREENGARKLDEQYLQALYDVVASSPEQHGWPRPTWTREMLVRTLRRLTGTRIHVSTMSRALGAIGARRGRPKPTVACPWSNTAKNGRLREIQRLIDALPADEVAVYEDEVDIHLNPKIGLDWEDRSGRDGAGTAKGGSYSGSESEAVSGRRSRCANRRTDLGRGAAENEPAVPAVVVEPDAALPESESDPRGAGQLFDPQHAASRHQPGDDRRSAAAAAFSASVLPGSQPDRTGVGRPARQRHAEPHLSGNGAVDATRAGLPSPA